MSNVYERLRVPTIINAKGTSTRVSGAPMPPEIAAAMHEATQHCVDMAQLQGRASEIIAEATGAEAGMVTAGASAGLLLGTAACLAGLDPARMNRLPDTTGMRDEAVVVRSQRNFYDHAVRAAGAHLVEVGLADRFSGAGVRDAEPWEIDDAIGERTACVFYVAQPSSRPSLAAVTEVAHANGVPVLVDAASQLPPTRNLRRFLEEIDDAIGERTACVFYVAQPSSRPSLAAVTEVARANGVPVLVDAASQLPPTRNLRRFLEEGADLVSISGGKAILGPQGSGILCGRRDLVASALLQNLDQDLFFEQWRPPSALFAGLNLRGLPQHGIGRSCKVGKEQIVALLVGLGRFVEEDIGERNQRCLGRLKEIEAAPLAGWERISILKSDAVAVRIEEGANRQEPCLVLEVAPGPHGHSAFDLVIALQDGSPAVHVDPSFVDDGTAAALVHGSDEGALPEGGRCARHRATRERGARSSPLVRIAAQSGAVPKVGRRVAVAVGRGRASGLFVGSDQTPNFMSAFVVRILALTGSSSRDILQPLTDNDLSNEAFAWLSVQAGEVGYARDVRLIRVSYAGELGCEIHHPVSCNNHLTDLLIRASAKAPDRRIARTRPRRTRPSPAPCSLTWSSGGCRPSARCCSSSTGRRRCAVPLPSSSESGPWFSAAKCTNDAMSSLICPSTNTPTSHAVCVAPT